MTMLHAATALLFILLAAITMIDARTRRIPDALNAALILSGWAATWALDREIIDSLIGTALGYAALWAVMALFRRVRGKEGLGLGDAKFLAGAGAWVGWMGLPFVVLIGSSLGLAWVALLRLRGRRVDGDTMLPFGPFLCVGAFATWAVLVYS